jgi:hypothetical protein
LRERFEHDEIGIDRADDKLAAQLGSIKWGIESHGRIKIESKDDMRKRGLHSRDTADAAPFLQSKRCADQCREPLRREHHRDLITKAWSTSESPPLRPPDGV